MSSTRVVLHLEPADPPPTARVVNGIPVVQLAGFPAAVEVFLSRDVDEAIAQADAIAVCFTELATRLARLKHEDEERRVQAAYESEGVHVHAMWNTPGTTLHRNRLYTADHCADPDCPDNPERTPGPRPAHRPGSFLDKRDRRQTTDDDPRPCKGINANVCVAEGCYGEACRQLGVDRASLPRSS